MIAPGLLRRSIVHLVPVLALGEGLLDAEPEADAFGDLDAGRPQDRNPAFWR